MARTKQTARKSTGGKRPRAQMSYRTSTPKTDKFQTKLQDLLYRSSSHQCDPLKLLVAPPPPDKLDRKLSASPSSSPRNSDFPYHHEDVLIMLMEHRISAYMDVQTIMLYRLTSATNWHKLEAAWERTVCRTFLLTTDMKQAAEHVVRGGWKAFLQFLSPLAHTIHRSFGQLGLAPPPLYRYLMAQQAIRRLDKSPYPLLWSTWGREYMGKAFRSHWKYQIPEFSIEVHHLDGTIINEVYAPETDRVPSPELCFGMQEEELDSYARETIAEDGRMMMPDEFILDKETRQPVSQNNLFSSEFEADVLHLLAQHVAWVAVHGREGSRRRQLASEGKAPFIFLAQDGTGTYRVYWAVTLDDDDEPVFCFLAPYQLSDYPPERPFQTAVGVINMNTWFFARSDENGWEWDVSSVDKYDLLQWAALAKSLRIRPFADDMMDPMETFADLQEEDEARQTRVARRARMPHEEFYEVDLDKEPKAIVEYMSQLELVVKDE